MEKNIFYSAIRTNILSSSITLVENEDNFLSELPEDKF